MNTLGPFWFNNQTEEIKCVKSIDLQFVCENVYTKRFGHVAFAIQDKLFVAGGYQPEQPKNITMICCDRKNLENQQWIKTLPSEMKFQFSASSVIGNKCYIFGGRKSPAQPSGDLFSFDYDGSILKINDSAKPRWGHTMNSTENKLFIIGGRDLNNVFDTIEEYDLKQDLWKSVSHLQSGIYRNELA